MAFLLGILPLIAGGLAAFGAEAAIGATAGTVATGLASAALATGSTAVAGATISGLSALAASSAAPMLAGLGAGVIGAATSAGVGAAIYELGNKDEQGSAPTGGGDVAGGQNVEPQHHGAPVSGGNAASRFESELNPGDILSAKNVYSHAQNYSGGHGGRHLGGAGGKISPAVLQEMAASAYGINGPSSRSLLTKDLRASGIQINAAISAADDTLVRYRAHRMR